MATPSPPASPKVADASYEEDFDSPTHSEASPTHKPAAAAEPTKPSTPPPSEPASPTKEATPPPSEPASPAKQPTPPPSEPASPTKVATPPPSEPASPAKQTTPPASEPASPTKETTPPPSEPASPAKQTTPPPSEPASPAKQEETPATPPRSPTPASRSVSPTPDPSPTKSEQPAPAAAPADTKAQPEKTTSDGDDEVRDAKLSDDEDAAKDPNPEAAPAGAADQNNASHQSNQSKIAARKRLPPRSSAVATVSYPGERPVAVAEILDPTKPLVKSTKPLTRPHGPSFVEDETAEERRQRRLRQKSASMDRTAAIAEQRDNERRYLKAQQEFEREKRLAERAIYQRERVAQWSTRLGASPLGVDLVADHERIDEEAFVRQREERRRRVLAENRKRRIKNEIIVKALAEVPLLEEARRQKREMLEEERREKALRDVQRVEAIQARKLRDMELMREERQAKLDQRLMNA